MAAIIALTPPLIPLICFMDLANFMFLSRSCTHKEEEGHPHSSNTSRKSFARLFSPSCIIPNNISHKNSVQATDFLQCKQCLCNVTVFENWSIHSIQFGTSSNIPNHSNRYSPSKSQWGIC